MVNLWFAGLNYQFHRSDYGDFRFSPKADMGGLGLPAAQSDPQPHFVDRKSLM
jgi:hypothetical protein